MKVVKKQIMQLKRMIREPLKKCDKLAHVSLCVGHCGVLDEGEVVGDVLVVRQPAMGPDQTILTNRHLKTRLRHLKF